MTITATQMVTRPTFSAERRAVVVCEEGIEHEFGSFEEAEAFFAERVAAGAPETIKPKKSARCSRRHFPSAGRRCSRQRRAALMKKKTQNQLMKEALAAYRRETLTPYLRQYRRELKKFFKK
jgi:hypothetical protein